MNTDRLCMVPTNLDHLESLEMSVNVNVLEKVREIEKNAVCQGNDLFLASNLCCLLFFRPLENTCMCPCRRNVMDI